jgi:hypothetical protein
MWLAPYARDELVEPALFSVRSTTAKGASPAVAIAGTSTSKLRRIHRQSLVVR